MSCKSYITAYKTTSYTLTGKRSYHTVITYIPLWTTSNAGLVVNIIPGDNIVEACGGRLPDREDESPVESFPQQLQDFLSLLAGWQEGSARGAAVPHSRVWVLRL